MSRTGLPRIAVTMGDPAGIGPEIVLKAASSREVSDLCAPIVFGDLGRLQFTADQLGLPVHIAHEAAASPAADPAAWEALPAHITVRQATTADLSEVRWGEISAAAGRAAAECVIAAAQAAQTGAMDALATAPLNKEAMALGGFEFPGHTELLAHITATPRYGMLLLSGPLRVVHVSTHVSLRQAIERVKTARILDCIRLGERACRELGIDAPRIAVAGLNPHAGENRMFGDEDADEIAPAVAAAVGEGINASGPYPPDTLFARASAGAFDLVVAMYHDQGHIPVKLHGFDTGVNVTIGLPILRTSVDHGTAFDIAGRGIASESSMIEAIRVAVRMAAAKSHKTLP